jgi:hypothetical protein
MRYGLSPHAEPEAFYGFYGNAFNCSRQAPPHEAYVIVQNWVQRRFTGTAADAAMQQAMKEALCKPLPLRAAEAPTAPPSEEARASAEAVPASGWQAQSALRAWGQAGPKGLLDLTGSVNDADRDADENGGDGDGGHENSDNDDDDDDDEAAANRPFDAHAPDLPGAFHVFTSVADGDYISPSFLSARGVYNATARLLWTDYDRRQRAILPVFGTFVFFCLATTTTTTPTTPAGHASKLFGARCVRECRGSLQLWQCGAASGPCRDSDAWEAPDGFAFRVAAAPRAGAARRRHRAGGGPAAGSGSTRRGGATNEAAAAQGLPKEGERLAVERRVADGPRGLAAAAWAAAPRLSPAALAQEEAKRSAPGDAVFDGASERGRRRWEGRGRGARMARTLLSFSFARALSLSLSLSAPPFFPSIERFGVFFLFFFFSSTVCIL